jgi:endonuclease/exonuclease/phosphatase family metal-dependent hydrolase
MKTLFLCLFLLFSPQDSLRVMFWNLENFFDYKDDSLSTSDREFSARGDRRWTKKRFQTKCNSIAKGILWAGSQEGGLPDAIGLAEVENAFALRQLLQTTALRKLDYSIVHFDSPDPRGIDVALLYRRSRLTLVDAKPCHLFGPDSTLMTTRDILLTRFQRADGGEVALLVNHHPSKYGGLLESEPRRRVAVERLRFLADSLQALGVQEIVAMGDFNDTPANPVYKILEPTLYNLAAPLHQKGLGTIKYDGGWELIDLFFVSERLKESAMKILQIPFLMTKDSGHAGTKPLRTYSGPRYQGGVSDHCPIWLVYQIK